MIVNNFNSDSTLKKFIQDACPHIYTTHNYLNGIFNLSSAFSSIENYMHSYVFIDNKTITNYLNRYW